MNDKASYSTEIPSKFICPLTLNLMVDPVMSREGHSYEKKAILLWLRKESSSPMTRAEMHVSDLVSNSALRLEIESWRYRHNYRSNSAKDSDTETQGEYPDYIDSPSGAKKKVEMHCGIFEMELSRQEMLSMGWNQSNMNGFDFSLNDDHVDAPAHVESISSIPEVNVSNRERRRRSFFGMMRRAT